MSGLPLQSRFQHHQPKDQPPNIWTQMSYIPPRGRCDQKTSLVTTCPCHRFMIHPLQASSSFNCDGCGHHACYHQMENIAEEEVVRRWREEVEQGQGREMEEMAMGQMVVVPPAKKRRRIADVEEREVMEIPAGGDEEGGYLEDVPVGIRGGKKGRGKGKGGA